jgi:CubicO group peptidase (beta-lactamase class C family)
LSLAQKIDSYLETNQKADLPGISILIVKNGKVAYSGSKGMADSTIGTSISAQTGFRLASVSKPFTAIAIMQLVERGQINLSDSLLDYIPELPSSWRKITIEQLLTHRSGIYDIINDGWKPAVLNGMTNDSLLTYLIQNSALEFEPGTQGDYSNTGYMLLAKVIERRTGLTFPNYMALNVFGPANMKGSYINDENQALKSGDALNYAHLRTYYGIVTYTKGSMAQVSSTDDFFNFFEALLSWKLVSANTLAEISKPRSTISGAAYGYGFGIFGDDLEHDGQWDGFETEILINAHTGIGWAILTNSGSAGRNHINAIRQIIYTTSF